METPAPTCPTCGNALVELPPRDQLRPVALLPGWGTWPAGPGHILGHLDYGCPHCQRLWSAEDVTPEDA